MDEKLELASDLILKRMNSLESVVNKKEIPVKRLLNAYYIEILNGIKLIWNEINKLNNFPIQSLKIIERDLDSLIINLKED